MLTSCIDVKFGNQSISNCLELFNDPKISHIVSALALSATDSVDLATVLSIKVPPVIVPSSTLKQHD